MLSFNRGLENWPCTFNTGNLWQSFFLSLSLSVFICVLRHLAFWVKSLWLACVTCAFQILHSHIYFFYHGHCWDGLESMCGEKDFLKNCPAFTKPSLDDEHIVEPQLTHFSFRLISTWVWQKPAHLVGMTASQTCLTTAEVRLCQEPLLPFHLELPSLRLRGSGDHISLPLVSPA